MTDPLAEQDDASTPLSPEERAALIPSYITLRGELNEAEQANILEADAWAFSRKRDVLDEGFLNTLHKRMYGDVWRWAGTYRKTQKNIGIEFYKIPTELREVTMVGCFRAQGLLAMSQLTSCQVLNVRVKTWNTKGSFPSAWRVAWLRSLSR
jgi:fido (protein-threonine AMPylation protein)